MKDDVMIERYHIEERNDITQHKEEKRNTNRGGDPNNSINEGTFRGDTRRLSSYRVHKQVSVRLAKA